MTRRDEWLARASRPAPARRGSPVREVLLSLGLGWLVLMTIWGVGRSGFEDRAGIFLAVGLVAGVTAAAGRLWSRRDRLRTPPG